MEYIAKHGEGRWNSLARCAGLKRTGKSCRLRWLNYLRPDVRRGNITPEEQLLILELHSLGETARWQLRCDVGSQRFKDVMRYLWMPRLLERICAASGKSPAAGYGSVGRGDQVESGTESSGCTETADHNGGGICDEGSEELIKAARRCRWTPVRGGPIGPAQPRRLCLPPGFTGARARRIHV
ncbi:hypothetical protein HPP92_001940 [Vanilla planifolia]|uniref:Uncharacterized protein n=1 Tax=Vanilla planifolia TaxID=51239 RepID=A0A835RX60_VANPL|nr:hypothetical protein HPP92_001940 [Vanilla planifolia]